MHKQTFDLKKLNIRPVDIRFNVPPILWKGDSVGHIGKNDVFFWVLEGECFLNIDSQKYIVRKGQLAYLPKGKMRMYTQVSESFSMYELGFEAIANDNENLMEALGLTEHNFVVDIKEQEYLKQLFENAKRKEMFKDQLYNVGWCADIINIIKLYAEAQQRQASRDYLSFKPVLEYMTQNLAKRVLLEDLANLVHMSPTHFVKKFRENFGMPPLAYLNNIRMHKAMNLLLETKKSVGEISEEVGVTNSSYFVRAFKKHAKVTPTEYRSAFKK